MNASIGGAGATVSVPGWATNTTTLTAPFVVTTYTVNWFYPPPPPPPPLAGVREPRRPIQPTGGEHA